MDVHAARVAGAPEGCPDRARGDGRDRRPGAALPGADSGGAVGAYGPLCDPRAVQARGPGWTAVRAADDPRGDGHVPRRRDPELQGASADLVPLPDEGPRRAASARRPPPRARVHHEGLVLLRRRRRRSRSKLLAPCTGIRADLRALRDRGLRCSGRVGDDGRERVDRLPGAGGLRGEHARHVRERRLRGGSRDRARRAARPRVARQPRRPAGGRDSGYRDDRGACRFPRDRPGGDVQGNARRHGRREPRARAGSR